MTESPPDPDRHVAPSRALAPAQEKLPLADDDARLEVHRVATSHLGPRTPLLRETPPLGSLPYLDDASAFSSVRADIERMVAEEAANGARRPAAYLAMLPPEPNVSALLRAVEKYTAPVGSEEAGAVEACCAPLSKPPRTPSGRHASSMPAWRSAVQEANATLEHATTSLVNTQMLTRYGGSLWKLANRDLETALRRARGEVSAVKASIAQLNRRRKSEQLRIGRDIGKASREYRRLVDKNCAISLALRRRDVE
jgi:hypothetical protein